MRVDLKGLRSHASTTFRATDAVTTLLVIGIAALIMFRVVNRWFQLGISGQGEAAQILLIWIVYLNIASAARNDRDIKSDYFFDKIPDRFQPGANATILLTNLAVTIVILLSALLVFEVSLGRFTTSLGLPVALLYLPLLIGSALLVLVYVSGLAATVRSAFYGDTSR